MGLPWILPEVLMHSRPRTLIAHPQHTRPYLGGGGALLSVRARPPPPPSPRSPRAVLRRCASCVAKRRVVPRTDAYSTRTRAGGAGGEGGGAGRGACHSGSGFCVRLPALLGFRVLGF